MVSGKRGTRTRRIGRVESVSIHLQTWKESRNGQPKSQAESEKQIRRGARWEAGCQDGRARSLWSLCASAIIWMGTWV